jgi:hypothetical protein
MVIYFMEEVLSPKSRAPSCGSVLVNFSTHKERISFLTPEDRAVILLSNPYS